MLAQAWHGNCRFLGGSAFAFSLIPTKESTMKLETIALRSLFVVATVTSIVCAVVMFFGMQ